jgi:hypothetical protein
LLAEMRGVRSKGPVRDECLVSTRRDDHSFRGGLSNRQRMRPRSAERVRLEGVA